MSKFHASLVRELRERGEYEAAAAIEAEENEAESLRTQLASANKRIEEIITSKNEHIKRLENNLFGKGI